MSRNLDPTMVERLPLPAIMPVVLANFVFGSGPYSVWSGVGDLLYNGTTYKGVGDLGKISAIQEASEVRADGMEVVLSGIGLSPFQVNNIIPPGVTPPPVTVPDGSYMAWSFATIFGGEPGFNAGNCAYNNVTSTGGGVSCGSGAPGTTGLGLQWTGFTPPVLPQDAVITAIYPVWNTFETGDQPHNFSPPTSCASVLSDGSCMGSSIGVSLEMLYSEIFSVETGNSITTDPGGVAGYNFLGFAVIFTTDSVDKSLIYEAENDIAVGAPASIYFGLWNGAAGELFGSPYLIFEGLVDQPTTDVSTQTSSITLALENKLSNLQRPNGRRWTSADQRIAYPDDSGFQFVEMLNDIALNWGGG